jgi:hypothetical protein
MAMVIHRYSIRMLAEVLVNEEREKVELGVLGQHL